MFPSNNGSTPLGNILDANSNQLKFLLSDKKDVSSFHYFNVKIKSQGENVWHRLIGLTVWIIAQPRHQSAPIPSLHSEDITSHIFSSRYTIKTPYTHKKWYKAWSESFKPFFISPIVQRQDIWFWFRLSRFKSLWGCYGWLGELVETAPLLRE